MPFVSIALVSLSLAAGPELVAHDMPGFVGYAITNGERAYSAAGHWCNQGDAPAAWVAETNQHPISVLNLVRIENGVLRHLGASWATHQYCALQLNVCGSCTPAGPGCPGALGVGCSTTSTASSLGSQMNMSRRSDANASTGSFLFPFAAGSPSGPLERRCRVAVADVDPAQHPNATFAFELVTLHPSDGDASHRCVTRRIATASMLLTPIAAGPADEGSTAVELWQSVVPSVTITTLDIPGDGRVLVAANATDLGSGLWRYDYAIENIDSHESVGALAIPLPVGAIVSETTSHAPLVHSGEVTSNAPWTTAVDGRAIVWSTEPFASNPNANAIRWGITDSFSVVCDRPPAPGQATLTLFRSALPIVAGVTVPSVGGTPLLGDLDADGLVSASDLSILLGAWGPCGACAADLNASGSVDSADLAILLGAWTE